MSWFSLLYKVFRLSKSTNHHYPPPILLIAHFVNLHLKLIDVKLSLGEIGTNITDNNNNNSNTDFIGCCKDGFLWNVDDKKDDKCCNNHFAVTARENRSLCDVSENIPFSIIKADKKVKFYQGEI